ncbi:hypothetical protein BaRGS_00004545 [Batillaria attramentaria]|uniref:Uncharacterized protein n=1 Tax=Batillaria attramentaria TaxID=370345 RepID=A0ABD0LYK0_9CAEN
MWRTTGDARKQMELWRTRAVVGKTLTLYVLYQKADASLCSVIIDVEEQTHHVSLTVPQHGLRRAPLLLHCQSLVTFFEAAAQGNRLLIMTIVGAEECRHVHRIHCSSIVEKRVMYKMRCISYVKQK